LNAPALSPALDWEKYGHSEMTLDEVRGLSHLDKFWDWVDVDGSQMFIAGGDDRIALRFHAGKDYESVTRELWRRLCKDAAVVADIGSHSGIFTLGAFRAGAKQVLSVEPHPFNFSRLVINLRRNGYTPGGAFYGAFGDQDRVGHLLVKNIYGCHAAGRMDMHNENGMELPVIVARMDSVMPPALWPQLRAVKIDAENFTDKVLIGMQGIFLEHRPDLIIECTTHGMGEMLKPLGYKFWRIWETGRIEEVDDLVPHNPENNYNGTDEDCRNRFASVKGLPDGL
jgi:FkbM family methyltransferase